MTEGIGRLLLPFLKLTERAPEPPIGAHDVLSVERAAPSYLSYLRLRWVARLLGALAGVAGLMAALLATDNFGAGAIVEMVGIVVIIAGATLNFLVITLDYRLRWYIITDRSLLIREGIWSQREITLTFANVQNVSVTQGPLERLFGISQVVVTTAGGSGASSADQKGKGSSVLGHEGHLRGLQNAHRVRDLIVDLMKQTKGAGLGDDRGHVPAPATGFNPAAMTALNEAATEARALTATLARG